MLFSVRFLRYLHAVDRSRWFRWHNIKWMGVEGLPLGFLTKSRARVASSSLSEAEARSLAQRCRLIRIACVSICLQLYTNGPNIVRTKWAKPLLACFGGYALQAIREVDAGIEKGYPPCLVVDQLVHFAEGRPRSFSNRPSADNFQQGRWWLTYKTQPLQRNRCLRELE